MNDWHVSASREVFANLVLRLDLERIRTPAGDETDWTVVTIGDGAAVCPIHEDGSVTLIRQYRHALGRTLWEFPAGRVEPDESPLEAARRELAEEAGLAAAEIIGRGLVVPLDGICRHVIHVFEARGLAERPAAHETFETIEVHRIERDRLRAMVRSGAIDCGITLSIMARLGVLEEGR
ncbi:MAG: NUDIX hydrolase [Planctomycetes bacterium]|nr:NUDIX hydrolase [Planctomycetota bacterium]